MADDSYDWFGSDDEGDDEVGANGLTKGQTAGLFGISSGAAAISSAIGAYGQASAQKSAFAYQASVAANNAQVSQWQASAAINAGQNQEEMSDLKTGEVFATQRATMAANGVDLATGSASEVLASTQVVGNIEATTIHNNALMSAWGYQVQGVNATNSENFNRAAGAAVNPGVSAASSLLTSFGNVASKWYSLSSAGAV